MEKDKTTTGMRQQDTTDSLRKQFKSSSKKVSESKDRLQFLYNLRLHLDIDQHNKFPLYNHLYY